MSPDFSMKLALLCLLFVSCSSLSGPSKQNIQQANSYFQAGVGFFHDQKYPESLHAFERAATLIPNDPNIEMHRALSLFYVNRKDQGIEAMRKACALRAEFPECHNNLSLLLLKTAGYSEALAAANKALESPTYSSPDFARTNKGLALHFLGREREAIQSFESIQERNVRSIRCRAELYLSRSHLALANFAEASRHARIGQELCENEAQGHLWMAYVEYRTGRIEEAKALLQDALRIYRDPSIRDQARVSLNRLNREEALAEPELFL